MIVLDGMQLYTPDEAAALIGMTTGAIQNRIRRGMMKAVIISGKRYVAGDELKAAAEKRKQGRRKRGAETCL